MAEFNLPTETVELPSRGLLYPENSPLASGTIEMKYMTAKEEDILTNRNYITNGTVIDKLLQSLITTPNLNYSDLLIGDKNALMIAARILSYGKDYSINYGGTTHSVDLSELKPKEVDYSLFTERKNEFQFILPKSQNVVTFKLLTHGDEIAVDKEISGLTKINKNESYDVTTRLKYMILSVNGSREQKDIREFVDKYLLATDARALREEYSKIQPDVNLNITLPDVEEDVTLPIGLDFFWPES